MQELNLRPSVYHTNALPSELIACKYYLMELSKVSSINKRIVQAANTILVQVEGIEPPTLNF